MMTQSLLRQGAGGAPLLPSLGLVAAVYEVGVLRCVVHRPVNLPVLMVVLADLGVKTAVHTMLEDMSSQGEHHGRVLRRLDHVLVRPCVSVRFRESPRSGLDKFADVFRKQRERVIGHGPRFARGADRTGHGHRLVACGWRSLYTATDIQSGPPIGESGNLRGRRKVPSRFPARMWSEMVSDK